MVNLTPGSCVEVCRFRVEMSNNGEQGVHNDLFISRQTLSLCLSSASISIFLL